MYYRPAHGETRLSTLRRFVRENPLGVLTTAISSPDFPFIQCSHIPFLLDVDGESSETELGRLRGHMARANHQSAAMIECLASNPAGGNTLQHEVMVLFTSPVQHYITPKFYTETKPDTGKVVPTWNYAAVQAYGRATIYFDNKDADKDIFLTKQIHDLSRMGEIQVMGYSGENGRPKPWSVQEAPERYIDMKKKGIIGIEIIIERLQGKYKMSQDKSEGDRRGIIKGFEDMGSEVSREMAQIVRDRGGL